MNTFRFTYAKLNSEAARLEREYPGTASLVLSYRFDKNPKLKQEQLAEFEAIIAKFMDSVDVSEANGFVEDPKAEFSRQLIQNIHPKLLRISLPEPQIDGWLRYSVWCQLHWNARSSEEKEELQCQGVTARRVGEADVLWWTSLGPSHGLIGKKVRADTGTGEVGPVVGFQLVPDEHLAQPVKWLSDVEAVGRRSLTRAWEDVLTGMAHEAGSDVIERQTWSIYCEY